MNFLFFVAYIGETLSISHHFLTTIVSFYMIRISSNQISTQKFYLAKYKERIEDNEKKIS